MYFVYVLESKKDSNLYKDYTSDLKERLEDHKAGRVKSTRDRRPLKLIYYEACLLEEDAKRREKFLKTSLGKSRLRKRLKGYFTYRERG